MSNPEMNSRLKVLFLACFFPPLQGSACVRTWNIAKYLARAGWDVAVVTPHPSLWRNINEPEKISQELDRDGIKRIFTGHRWRCLDPDLLKSWNAGIGWVLGGACRKLARHFAIDSAIGWMKEAELACKFLTPNQVDVIVATGPPFVAFSVAKRLAHRLGRPYVLDYRDVWGARPSASQATRNLERDLIEDCQAITVISESLLKSTCNSNSKVNVITNGYDPEELDPVKPYDFGHFAIVFAGVFRPPWTVISPVMAALRRLKDKSACGRSDWKFHYYGPHGEHVREEAKGFGVEDKIVLHGRVPRTEALSAVRGSNLTVVITSVLEAKAEWEKGVVTGKLFDSLGLQVPVLLIGPAGTDVDGIIEQAGLARKLEASNIDGMTSFIEEVMSGKVPSVKNPDTYAWPNIIKGLDVVLRETLI